MQDTTCHMSISLDGFVAGPEGLEILVVGAPNLGENPREDVDGQRHWWAD